MALNFDICSVRPKTVKQIQKNIKVHDQKRKDWQRDTAQLLDVFFFPGAGAMVISYINDENWEKLRSNVMDFLNSKILVYFGEAPLWVPSQHPTNYYGYNLVTHPEPEYGWCLMSGFALAGYFNSMKKNNKCTLRTQALDWLTKYLQDINNYPIRVVVIEDFFIVGPQDEPLAHRPQLSIDGQLYELPWGWPNDTYSSDSSVQDEDGDVDMDERVDTLMDGRLDIRTPF
jgi:hypothetical protein